MKKYLLCNKNFTKNFTDHALNYKFFYFKNNRKLEQIIKDLNKLNIKYNIKYINNPSVYLNHNKTTPIEYIIIKSQQEKMESLLLNYKLNKF
jgi:hypothetical protein